MPYRLPKHVTVIVFTLLVAFAPAASGLDCPVIPLPSKVTQANGTLRLGKLTRIRVDDREFQRVAQFLQVELLKRVGLPLATSVHGSTGPAIVFTRDAMIAAEAYRLNVSPGGVEVRASSPNGAFYGVVSFLQLVCATQNTGEEITIPSWQIEDQPELAWRGFMLDESRHFFGVETVKTILDWMAFYKLNRFHWHLTDVPGWRVEIKAFPKLTLIGGIGNHTDPLAPAKYYTQEDIREIVRYAAERFIEVIPEIDMPGHAAASNRAYPEYSGGGSANYPEFTFNPGKEETYGYLTTILREVDVLFPSKMIHLGGDEVHFGNEKWNTDKDVQALMKKRNLKDLKAVEEYFVERMADSIAQLDSKVLGWDEIASMNMDPKNTVIFWWRQDKPEMLKVAIDHRYTVVLCPRIPLYFDFVQDNNHLSGRKWKGAFSDLRTIYNFSYKQYPDIIKDSNQSQVAGIQANLWTETIESTARLEYMLFPRISALAEAAWTRAGARDYEKYLKRLAVHQRLYKEAGLHYYDVDTPGGTPEIVDVR